MNRLCATGKVISIESTDFGLNLMIQEFPSFGKGEASLLQFEVSSRNDKLTAAVNAVNKGDVVSVEGYVKGRDYKGKVYHNLGLLGVDVLSGDPQTKAHF